MYVLLYHVIIKFFFPPSLFGQVCIFALKIRNWWPPWSEIRSALGWKIKRSTQNPVFPVTIALSVVEKKIETDYRRKMYCACLNCWLIGTTFALGSLRLHVYSDDIGCITKFTCLQNYDYVIMNNLKMDDLGHHVFVPHVKFWNVRTFEPNSSSPRIFDYSLPFKRSQVLAPCTSSSFYPILLLIG